ncbi:MAG TPA: hypothetical protein VK669_02445 [Candidatus Limnocylindrales bacterium]|nr:hypothetical protein [Candidatus Limnocylindrales bacterium]
MRVPTISAALIAALLLGSTAVAQADTAAVDQSAAPATPVVAQATPNPSASPAGTTNPGPSSPSTPAGPQSPSSGPTQTQSAPPPLGHYPILDFVVTFTQPAYYGNRNALPVTGLSPVNRYDPLDIGGTIRIPVTRKLNLLFDRVTEGTLNQPLECVLQPNPAAPTNPTVRVCPSDSRDILLQYHATYQFDRYVTLDVGDSFRHRIWTNGATGVSTVPFLCNNNGQSTGANCTVSSTEHHFGYAGLTYTTKPWRDLWNSQFSFAETIDAQNVDHHVAIQCSAGNLTANTHLPHNQITGCNFAAPNANTIGYYDEVPGKSKLWETTQGISWIYPVDPRHGTTFLLNERWGALNFYENPGLFGAYGVTTGQPYRWTSALVYQLSKRFSPGFTLAMRHSDFHSVPQGTPFVAPNAIHVGSWDVIGTFHLDTNTWFH